MGTARAIFMEVERGRATRIHVTRNHVTESDVSYSQSRDRKRPCPEGCAHAQPEHVVSHVTDPDRKSRARKGPGIMFCAFPGFHGYRRVEGCAHAQPEVAQYPT
jgi:hypothetical protein